LGWGPYFPPQSLIIKWRIEAKKEQEGRKKFRKKMRQRGEPVICQRNFARVRGLQDRKEARKNVEEIEERKLGKPNKAPLLPIKIPQVEKPIST